MSKLSISRAWDETRAVLSREGRLLVTVALALILLPQVVSGAAAPPQELSGQSPPAWLPILALIVGLLGIVAQIAIVRLALRSGTSVGEAISHGFRRFLPAFLAVMLFVLAVLLIAIPLIIAVGGNEGMAAAAKGQLQPQLATVVLLLLIAAIAIGARLQLIVPAASEEGGGPIRLLKRTWQLSKGNYWRLLAFLLLVLASALFVLLVGTIIGGILARGLFGDVEPFSVAALLLAFAIGAIQAAISVVISVMLARIYAQIAGVGEDGRSTEEVFS